MKPYGELTVICGPMYAGKTTEILKRVLWARNGQGKEVLVIKPSMDFRYSETEIVSHDGLRVTALSVTNLPKTDGNGGLIVLDEVQFFHPGYMVVQWIAARLQEGYEVVAAGLDMDWTGKPFEVTANLVAMADNVVKLHANCTVCGQAARKTYKKDQSGGPVEIGAQDKYEARCNAHWVDVPEADTEWLTERLKQVVLSNEDDLLFARCTAENLAAERRMQK